MVQRVIIASMVMLSVSFSAAWTGEIHFDELLADNQVGNPFGLYRSAHYRQKGVSLRTVTVRGNVAVGQALAVELSSDGFEVIGGRDQPAISPPNLVIPVGGRPNGCILMEFAPPVSRVRVTTDRFKPERPDVVRLLGLKATANKLYTIQVIDEKNDDALLAPNNQLEIVVADGVQWVLFQCTTEREGFDDLQFDSLAETADQVEPVKKSLPKKSRRQD